MLSEARRALAFFFLAASFVAVLLTQSFDARAQGITVSPLRVNFAVGKTTETVTLINNTNKPVVVQSSAVRWSQVQGKDQLDPTRDLLVSPALVEIQPGQRQSVRIVQRIEQDAVRQKTYRLVLEEVVKQDDSGTTQLKMALRITLPIFVAPKQAAKPDLEIVQRTGANGAELFLSNRGNSHIQVISTKAGDAGATSGAKSEVMFYVLPGSVMPVRFPNSVPPFSEGTSVELRTDSGALKIPLKLE